MTTVLPRTRLGKRSPMGALVTVPCGVAEGLQGPEGDDTAMGPGAASGFPSRSRVKLYPGQKVYLMCGGREVAGLVDQHNHVDNEVSVFLPQLGQHFLRKTEDVWTTPMFQPQAAAPSHPVSSSIDVPKSCRSPESVEMDEMMAAMVLTSLSCSPVVQSPTPKEHAPASCGVECGGGELSDSGSSGCWSWDRGSSPAPSPPIAEGDGAQAPCADEGLEMELEQVLFEEPAPRKRRNSVKVGYRCLWPNCGKVLTSVVGIKRHIRTLHLGHSGEPELSRREEDFYYTEIHRDAEPTPAPAPPAPVGTPTSSCISPSSPIQLIPPGSGLRPLDPPTLGTPQTSLLSQSAPGCFWQVQSEHSYQACSPVQVIAAPVPSNSCHWTSPVAVLHTTQAAPVRSRSGSVGEQWLQQHSAPIRPHAASGSPPRGHCTSRKGRGEAKKCRKVYGIEHRDQWCTACRWKKACQRFLD
ncbi:zinc finger protein 395a [Paramormyrops kingsleyae]|uniref:C2H2-type domain-containing protein n=1 Tax=Paramormyrops kingsleyae TaxID=1676925 RepID=A0A3B3SPC0_9TELE|nr:zinc finger protein 395-like [Paramormyrops kingsleyae]XP_023681102.1 zinc finger protein 395-like [Paramormyrops kingsleyae]XP_023681103.1 zinc finger protein 395-like [Paramormyrops kingsleyae]XP_023681104.1 zinc finger protein 395-like [Paramormyrops kingsleyae]